MTDEPALTLLSSREAARFLRMADSTLRAKVKAGELPVIRFGGPGSKLFFAITDLQAFIAKHRTPNGGGDA